MSRIPPFLPVVAVASMPFVALENVLAQDLEKNLPEACDETRCYQPGLIFLTLDDGSETTLRLETAVPIISDDIVSMLPGATVFVRGDVVDGKLMNLRGVKQPAELRDVLQIRMWQEPRMADTFLTVTNHFHEVVKYRAAMLVPRFQDFLDTSSCPVLGDGRVSYEHWHHTIVQLALDDFELIGAEPDELTCE